MKHHNDIKGAGMRKRINDQLYTKHKMKKNITNLSFHNIPEII
jgi:hypothetical protein